MNEIVIEVQKPRRSRLFGSRIAVLTTAATLLISGAFAISFYVSNSPIEFGQTTGTIQACGYLGNGQGFQVVPSSNLNDSGFTNLSSLSITDLSNEVESPLDNCANKVISVALDFQGTTYDFTGSSTTIEIYNKVDVPSGDAAGDLIAANDVKLCSSNGLTCTTATAEQLTVENSNGGSTILISGSLLENVQSGDLSSVAIQTTSGFSDGTLGS
jgi:hypothetical protein